MSESSPTAEIETFKGFRLSPFQREAVASIRSGHNVLVSAPTGSGKTLVAEYAIELAMNAGRRCIYTAPIKALSNQKYRDFRDVPDLDVGISTGDVTIVGHTDTSGASAYNQRLSARRASVVSDALQARGVDAEAIDTAGRGEDDLAKATRDGVREPLNRRSEVTIIVQ